MPFYCNSEGSTCYSLSYSEQENFEQKLRERKLQKQQESQVRTETRREQFIRYHQLKARDKQSIFNIKGLEVTRFGHRRIKIRFTPSEIKPYISKQARFWISLRYVDGHWKVRRDSVPVNCKLRLYSLFYTKYTFRISDEHIINCIWEIRDVLVNWTKDYSKFRLKKYQRWKRGEDDIYIDSEDEELFLSDTEIEELHEERERILQRMLPPQVHRRRIRRRII